MAAIVATETVDRAREIRKALQVLARLEVVLAHRGRKAQHFGMLVRADARDGRVQAIGHRFEHGAAAIQALDAGIDQQASGEQFVEIGGLGCRRDGRFRRATALRGVSQCMGIHR